MGEREEMAAFCRRAFPELVGALSHHFGDPGLAQELAQEALIRACDRWPRVRQLDSPTGWAFHVGVNLGRSRLRRGVAERRALARRGPDASPDLSQLDESIAVRQAVGSLPVGQRAVIVSRFYLGLSTSETAEALGLSAGAVRTRTARGLATLRDAMGLGTAASHKELP